MTKQSPDDYSCAGEIASLRLLPWMACMQKMQRSDVSEHFSVAMTRKFARNDGVINQFLATSGVYQIGDDQARS